MRSFTPIQFEPTEDGPRLSREIFHALKADIIDSKHGNRFALRELPPGNELTGSVFDVDQPYMPASNVPEEHRDNLAQTAGNLIMPRKNWEALVEAFESVYRLEPVRHHLSSGGVLKYVDSHMTYVGQVAQELASHQALRRTNIEAPHEIQTTIVSRITSLFRLPLLQQLIESTPVPHHEGAIIDDLLLLYGGALLTIPNSKGGFRVVQAVQDGVNARRGVVSRTKLAYEQLVNRGGEDGQIFFEGSSGAENELSDNGDYMIIGEVQDGTVSLTTDYNDTDGAERIMVIPVFMEAMPFTGNPSKPIEQTPTPFAFLSPRFPKSRKDFDQLMKELAVAGTRFKRSGQPPYSYEKRTFGRKVSPDYIATFSV